MAQIKHDTTLLVAAIKHAQQLSTLQAMAKARTTRASKFGINAAWLGLGFGLAIAGLSLKPSMTVASLGPKDVSRQEAKAPWKQDKRSSNNRTTVPQVKVITDYVVFHAVNGARGRIETGWHYASANDSRPDREWCQLVSYSADGTGRITPFEMMHKDEKINCVWFSKEGRRG